MAFVRIRSTAHFLVLIPTDLFYFYHRSLVNANLLLAGISLISYHFISAIRTIL